MCSCQVLICELCFDAESTTGIFLDTITHENQRVEWTHEQQQRFKQEFKFFRPYDTIPIARIIDEGPLVLYIVRSNKEIRLSQMVSGTDEAASLAELSGKEETDLNYEYYCQQLQLFCCIARWVLFYAHTSPYPMQKLLC